MATFVKPRFTVADYVEPIPGAANRINNNVGIGARSRGASWIDIARAYNVDCGRLVEFFKALGIVRRIKVGTTQTSRIEVNGQFSDRGFSETYLARGKKGQCYTHSIVTDEGLRFIASHYYAALVELSKNDKMTGRKLIKKHDLQPFTALK